MLFPGKIHSIFSKVTGKVVGKPHNINWAKRSVNVIDLWKTMLWGEMPWINGPWTFRGGKRIGTRSRSKLLPWAHQSSEDEP